MYIHRMRYKLEKMVIMLQLNIQEQTLIRRF